MTCAPARTSPSISRSTAGTGARAPAPVSSSGYLAAPTPGRGGGPGRGRAAGPGLRWAPGGILQPPRQTLALPSAGRGGQHRPGDRLGREVGLELGDDAEQGLGRVLVDFGPARDAVRALLTVADTNRPELPAVGARLGFGTACPAVPVLPATLQASQRLAAVGAYGCRDVARACVAQRDEQVTDL